VIASDRPPVLPIVEHLRATIDAVTVALISGDSVQLLTLEGQLVDALAAALNVRVVDVAERQAVTREIDLTRLALHRCAALGSALRDVTAASLASLSGCADYDRDGTTKARERTTGGVTARA